MIVRWLWSDCWPCTTDWRSTRAEFCLVESSGPRALRRRWPTAWRTVSTPRSAPRRTPCLAVLRNQLNQTKTYDPGCDLVLRYSMQVFSTVP